MPKATLAGAIVLVVIGATLSFAQTIEGVKTKDPRLQAAIEGRQKGIYTRNASEWTKYTTDDFVTVSPEGEIVGAESALKDQTSLPPAGPMNKVVIDSVRMYGPDTAISIQHNSPSNNRITIVWVRQGGMWKAASSHSSAIKGK
jgi:hypothetical protein